MSLAGPCPLLSSSTANPTLPRSGPSNEKQRGSAEWKSESQAIVAERKETCCRRFLPVGCQYPKPFRADRRSQEGRCPSPESRVRMGERPLLVKPYLLGKPLPGRRQPVKAASREAVARNAPALTGCRWSGTLGFKLARPALPLTTPARAFCPSSIRCRRHCA